MIHTQLLRKLIAATALFMLGSFVVAGDAEPANTMTLKAGMSQPEATIDAVKWIAGNWAGEAFGGMAEEMWGQPQGGSMMGSYRLVKDGKVIFYELQTIVEHDNSLVFRLKHFNPDLSGWEEKQAVAAVSFPLVKITSNAVYFDGLTFRKLDDGAMQVFLRINQGGGKTREEGFSYQPQ